MTRSGLLLVSLLSFGVVAAACGNDSSSLKPVLGAKRTTTNPATGQVEPDYNDPHVTSKETLPDPLELLSKGQAQNDALCARAGAVATNDSLDTFNAITSMLCKTKTPITSIRDLEDAIGLTFPNRSIQGTNSSNGNPGFAFLANSSSLVARSVSAINPRAFLFSPPQGQPTKIPGFTALAFARGEQFVEIAAQSPKGNHKLSLYLVKFDLPCGTNCGNGDLLTPNTEKNWSNVTVYDDEDLKNTLMDCRECHQPQGPSQPLMLRMQELQTPWTHWFKNDVQNTPGGVTLMQDYFRAHSTDEDYGGIPGVLIDKSDGRALEDFLSGQGFGDGGNQPNEFNTLQIEQEIENSQSGQPAVNIPKGSSQTWDGIFQTAFQGNAIPVPYHDVKNTDPDKLQFATDSYKAFMSGSSTTLDTDIRRVFLDDALEDMTMLSKTGATGAQVLVQTCAHCHNPSLDQTLTRARFDVTKLSTMSAAEKSLAITRMKLDPSDRLHMPPAALRSLPDDALKAAVGALQ